MHYKTGMFKQSMVTVYYTIKPGRIQNHMYNINQYQTKKKKKNFLLANYIHKHKKGFQLLKIKNSHLVNKFNSLSILN